PSSRGARASTARSATTTRREAMRRSMAANRTHAQARDGVAGELAQRATDLWAALVVLAQAVDVDGCNESMLWRGAGPAATGDVLERLVRDAAGLRDELVRHSACIALAGGQP